MAHRVVSVLVVLLHFGVSTAFADVDIKVQDDGAYLVVTPNYTARLGRNGYLQSIRAGDVEMLKTPTPFGTATFIAASVPPGNISRLSKGIEVLKMDKVEWDQSKKTAVATGKEVRVTYEFRNEDILIKPRMTVARRLYFFLFPSENVVRSLDGLTDFSVSLTEGDVRAMSQEGMRWVTRQGAVFRFDEDVVRGSNNGYASFYWWTDDERKLRAVTTQALEYDEAFVIRPMADPGPSDAIQFAIGSENPNFLQPGGKPATFDIKAVDWSRGPQQVDVDFEVRDYLTNATIGKNTTRLSLRGIGKKDGTYEPSHTVKAAVPVPAAGVYRGALVVRQAGQEKKERELKWVFTYDFPNYRPAGTRPPDFKQFWTKTLADVRAVPMDVQMTLHADKGNARVDCYAVSIATLEGRRCWFWYFRPKAAGKYPVLFECPPTGLRIDSGGGGDGTYGRLVFTVHTLGLTQKEVDQGPARWRNYIRSGWESPETTCWRTIYASMVRCLDFLAERPEVDPKRIAVQGSSQGGGLSVVLAGLDNRVAACLPQFGGLSRLDWTVKHNVGYWPFTMQVKPEGRTEAEFLKTLSYFDAANFTPDIQCPTVCLVGMLDWVTASGGTVCAMAHLKPGQVQLIADPWGGHGSGDPKYARLRQAAISRFLKGELVIDAPSK